MKELVGLHLRNYVMWPKFDMEFEPGVTRIEGQNRSGKSLTFGAMTQALWGSAAAKRGTDAAKIPKGSKTSVTFKDGKDTWRVEGSGSSVQIFCNDVSREMSGSKTGRSEFQAAMGMSQELYDASVVIGSKPNPLTHATPLQRVDWFHSVFGLDQQYDRVLKNVAPLLATAKKAQETLDALRGERKFIVQSAVKPGPGKTAKELTAVLARLRLKQTAASSAATLLLDREQLSAAIGKLKKPSIGIEEAEEHLEKYRKQLKNDDYLVSKMEFRAETVAQAREIKAGLKRLEKVGTYAGGAAERHAALLNALLAFEQHVQAQWADWQAQSPLREASKTWKPMKVRDIDAIAQELEPLMRKEYALDQRVRALSKPIDVCSECGQVVPKGHREKERRALRKEHLALLARIDRLREERDRAADMASLTMKHAPPDLYLVQALIPRLEGIAEAESKRKILNDQLLLMPASYDTPTDALPMPEEKRKFVEQRVARLKGAIDIGRKREHAEASIAALDAKLSSCKFKSSAEASQAARMIEKLIEKLERRRDARLAAEATFANSRKSLAVMDDRIAEVRKAAEPFPVLDAIHRASGRSGLRMTRLGDMVEAFQSYLNEAAPLLWPVDHKFLITHDEKGIDIALQRANEVVSDLSVMSQSEGQVWRLLCAYALVRMVPSRMRIDTIVLDELESHMDEPAKLDYAKSFLPALAEIVPKVIVISPMSSSELPIDFNHRYVVKTGKSGSSLIQH